MASGGGDWQTFLVKGFLGYTLTVTATRLLLLLCESSRRDTHMNKHHCVPVQLCLRKQAVGCCWPLNCGFPTPDLEGKVNIYKKIRYIICNAKLVNFKTVLRLRATDENSLRLWAQTINQFNGGKMGGEAFSGRGTTEGCWNDGMEVSLMKRQLREQHCKQKEQHMPKPYSTKVF